MPESSDQIDEIWLIDRGEKDRHIGQLETIEAVLERLIVLDAKIERVIRWLKL